MASVLDYVGRSVDVLAYDGSQINGTDVLLSQTLAAPGTSGKIVTGILKLSQRYTLELLTEKGSMPYWPSRGNDFITQARQGYLRTSIEALAAFSAAAIDIKRNLQSEELSTDPLDERFSDAQMLNMLVSPGKMVFQVNVISLAGSSRKVILPINVVI